ncbi:MAG: hypothetical protein FLDDKLPJ_02616 [Phycisphaerae bacterium]|nr:hypothetical protein [Phycisphaerae bacterium]
MPFSLTRRGTAVIVHLTGLLENSEWVRLIDDLDELAGQGHHRIVLDLSGLESIESSGLGSVVQLVSRCRMRGSSIGIACPNAFVLGVLEVTRLDQWIGVSESVEHAIADDGATR